jgi:hypothetical protein
MVWSDEKLDELNVEQLKNLFANLGNQRESGRIGADAAEELSQRITARLPAVARNPRRPRPRALIKLDARVAENLGDFAAYLGQRYDLSEGTARERSIDIPGFRPEAGTDKRGLARAGASVKKGSMAIDRFIAYRVRDSMASLAFLLLPDLPHDAGLYVIFATEDLLESGVPITDMIPSSLDHGWSRDSRERLRAQRAGNFAEAQVLYEGLIASLATKRVADQ